MIFLEANEQSTATAIYEDALAREPRSPRESVVAYEESAKANNEAAWAILLIPALTFPASYLIAYYATAGAGKLEGILAAAIIGLLGAGPMWALVVRGYRRRGLEVLPDSSFSGWADRGFFLALNVAVLVGISLFGPVLELAVLFLVAGLVFIFAVELPYGIVAHFVSGEQISINPNTAPRIPALVAFWTIFAVVFALNSADLRLWPPQIGRIARQLPWGLKAHWQRTASFVGSIAFGILLAATVASEGLLFRDPAIGVLVYAIVGALLGATYYRDERDPMLGGLIEIAKARCRFQIGERLRAEYELSDKPMALLPPVCRHMSEALLWILTEPVRGRDEALRELSDARRSLDMDDRHAELCAVNIERIQSLLST